MAVSHPANAILHLRLGKRIGAGTPCCCRSPNLISHCPSPICSMLGTCACLGNMVFWFKASFWEPGPTSSSD